jgi:broad specificity phosphatase PhoE
MMPNQPRLILIRHGQTDWNATGRWQGQADPPLNDTGRAQARQIALQLISQSIDVLISSDLARARETAKIIGAVIGLPVQLEPRLREINLGDWQGLYSDEIRARWPHEMETWIESPLAIRPPHGESIRELADRVWAAVADIVARYPNQRLSIVTHELPIASLIVRHLGLPLAELRAHIPRNAAWHMIEW